MLYCVIPRDVEGATYEALVEGWRGRPDVIVIVDWRSPEPRSRRRAGSGERRHVGGRGLFLVNPADSLPPAPFGGAAA